MKQKLKIFSGSSAQIEHDILEFMKTGYKIKTLSSAFNQGNKLYVTVVFQQLESISRPKSAGPRPY